MVCFHCFLFTTAESVNCRCLTPTRVHPSAQSDLVLKVWRWGSLIALMTRVVLLVRVFFTIDDPDNRFRKHFRCRFAPVRACACVGDLVEPYLGLGDRASQQPGSSVSSSLSLTHIHTHTHTHTQTLSVCLFVSLLVCQYSLSLSLSLSYFLLFAMIEAET